MSYTKNRFKHLSLLAYFFLGSLTSSVLATVNDHISLDKGREWLQAAADANLDKLKVMLEGNSGYLTYQSPKNGSTALHKVIEGEADVVKKVKTIKWLLQKAKVFNMLDYINVDMQKRHWEGMTAPTLAARPRKSVEIIKTIVTQAKQLDLTLDLNQQSKEGYNAFIVGCSGENEEVLAFLLENVQKLHLDLCLKMLSGDRIGLNGLMIAMEAHNNKIPTMILNKAKELNIAIGVNETVRSEYTNQKSYTALTFLLRTCSTATYGPNEPSKEAKQLIKQLIDLGATINDEDILLAKKANLLPFIKEEVKKYKKQKLWKVVKIVGIVIFAIGAVTGITYLLLKLVKKSKTEEKPTEPEYKEETDAELTGEA